MSPPALLRAHCERKAIANGEVRSVADAAHPNSGEMRASTASAAKSGQVRLLLTLLMMLPYPKMKSLTPEGPEPSIVRGDAPARDLRLLSQQLIVISAGGSPQAHPYHPYEGLHSSTRHWECARERKGALGGVGRVLGVESSLGWDGELWRPNASRRASAFIHH